ncbi:MAG: putative lipid II flippase FtsW [Nakamurella sp.]
MTSLHLVIAIFLLLLAIGLTMVLSASSAMALKPTSKITAFADFQKQSVFAAIGLVAFYFVAKLPVKVIRGWSTAMVMASLVMLVAVLVPGIGLNINGAQSWIGISKGLSFQPSEIAKLSLLLWSAHVFAARRSTLGSFKQLFFPVIPVTLLMGGLIVLQPDVGTLVTMAIVIAAVLWFAGAQLRWFISAAVLGLAGLAYLSFSAEYRLNRIKALLDPSAYSEISYQLLQGLYGMGRGSWFGVGLGESRAKWSWLPYANSDFIFAIIGEELGLIGAGLVIALFALLAYTGMRIVRRSVDPFSKIAAGACTVWLVGQASINIGYVVGALPTTGLTLPMISSGGTSLLVTMAVFGLLANFARNEPAAAAALRENGPGRMARWLGWGTRQ